MYGNSYIGRDKSVRVKFHENLSMILDYTTKGEVKNWYAKVCEKHDWLFSDKDWKISGSSKPGNRKYI